MSPDVSVKEVSEEEIASFRRVIVEYHEWNSTTIEEKFGETYDSQKVLAKDREKVTEMNEEFRPFLVESDEEPAGGMVLCQLNENISGIKRLYVRPDFRQKGIGHSLLEKAIEVSEKRGNQALRLNTGPHSRAARALYEKIGFKHIPPYPVEELPEQFVPDWTFMELKIES